ncbi:MAG TPA: thioredoxin domain-containing protein [Nannocystaceae bacterium]|nr:thioredoxin domain-containing protein [Nannocystaceae bacterium]
MTAPTRATSLVAAGPDAARRPFLLLVLLALFGAADGAYLSYVHLDLVSGLGEVSQVCHRFSETGCRVTAGRFGSIYGIPIATYGLAGSLAIAVLGVVAFFRRKRWEDPYRSTIVVLAAIALVASLTMAILSSVEKAFCPFCVAWYFVDLALAWAAWRCRDRELGMRDTLDDSIGTPALVAALVFGATLYGVTALMGAKKVELEAERDAALIPPLAAELLAQTPQEVDVPDAPSKGPEDAEVTFVEFGDFECPFCRKLYMSLEYYAQTSGRTTRVVFVNYPLDATCNPEANSLHPHACMAAFAGECARQQDRFWEYAQALFEHQDALERDDLLGYAKELSLDVAAFTTCLDAPATKAKIRSDIDVGGRVQITGTPTFFVNGYKWTGALPPSILAGIIDQMLAQGASQ